MSCKDIERQVGPFMDGELPDSAAREVESHLAACPRCAGEAGRLQELRALSARASFPAVSPAEWAVLRGRVEAAGARVARGEQVISFPRRASPWRLLPACAAAVLVAGLLLFSGGPPERPMQAEDGPPASGPAPEIQVEPEATLLKYVDF